MKVLVTGSRSIDDDQLILDAIRSAPFQPETVIHGDESRVDELGEVWAVENRAEVESHPVPDWAWEQVGRKAGPLRNGYMVQQADAVVAVWDGESSGTKDTIKKAESDGLPVYKVCCDETDDGWSIRYEELMEDDQASLDRFE